MRCALAVLLLALLGCTAQPDEPAPRVVTAAWPLAWLAEAVGGDDVEVVDLSDGGDPHAVEGAAVRDGDVVLAPTGLAPGLDDAEGHVPIDQLPASSDLGDEEGGLDPHVWLDPVRLAGLATALGARLEERVPGSEERAARTAEALQQVDARYRDALAACERRELVTSHTAFGALAARYDLRHVGVAGTDPGGGPSSGRLAEVARFARDAGVTTVFVSPGDDEAAATLARELGATTTPLSALEAPPEDGDLLGALEVNLQALRTGLGCV